MLIYDKTSLAFIAKAERLTREILESIGIKVGRSRISVGSYTYPLEIVVFDGGQDLGNFNSKHWQIGLNRKLVYLAKDSVLRDILKHELAHFFTYIKYRDEVNTHGPEFRKVCAEFGFPEEIAAATLNLEEANLSKEGDLASERVIEKVKKLLQLAQSSNTHEAELATIRANELLLRHNISGLSDNEEPVYLDRILYQPRKDVKQAAIYEILRHFVVKTVINNSRGMTCLEISGPLTNVKLARYVGEFLNRELDHLWALTKKEHKLTGIRAKNSFFNGVARGFDEKMKKTESSFSAEDQKALIRMKQKLNFNTSMIYGRLGSSRSNALVDTHAMGLGIQKGRDLNIRQGVESTNSGLYLPGTK